MDKYRHASMYACIHACIIAKNELKYRLLRLIIEMNLYYYYKINIER